MTRGINDGDVEFCGLEFPQGNVNGDTTFSLSLQFVQHPGIFEGALAHLIMRNINLIYKIIAYKRQTSQNTE